MVHSVIQTTEEDKEKVIHKLEKQFHLSTGQSRKIAQLLENEMKTGLSKQDDDSTSIPMLPSWITSHPTGQELGEYIGLDVSGSYIRVYLVWLHGQGRITTLQMKYRVKKAIKRGSIGNLVEFMAEFVEFYQ